MVRTGSATSGAAEGARKMPRLQAHLRADDRPRHSARALREIENHEAVGGMRNPFSAVGKVPGLRGAGRRVRRVIEDFMQARPDAIESLEASMRQKVSHIPEELLDALAVRIASELGAGQWAKGPKSLWRAGLVQAFVREANDPDAALGHWLEHGAPTGVAKDVECCGVFPRAEPKGAAHQDIWKFWAQVEPTANYSSVKDNEQLVRAEIDRLERKGFVTRYPDWNAVIRRFGQVVVSKMAAVVKRREDGSTKLRIIIDMLRSHVNELVRLHERLVLPRIQDLLEDTLHLLGLHGSPEDLDMLVVDWEDAFHSMGVAAEELPHQVVRGFGGEFLGYETVLFGGAGSPDVWGRAGAFLGRSGAALFEESEARLQVYVDDPWSIWRGSPEARRHNRAVLLLWWLVLGPPLSWSKVQLGRQVKWIGVVVRLVGNTVHLELDERFIEDIAGDVEETLGFTWVAVGRLRKLAGKVEWAAGIIPYLKAMIMPLWAATADAPGGRAGVRRIRHALRWLRAFFRRRRGVLDRVYSAADRYAPTTVVIELDASPWGYGGVLYQNGSPVHWFAEAVSKEDVATFGIVIGDPRHQALLEIIAVLIGLRTWSQFLRRGRWAVHVRSDSQAAIGAALKLRSPEPAINAVVRELALDLAEGKYSLDFFEHLPGRCNVYADVLSRFYQPGKLRVVPAALAGATRSLPEARPPSWWETAAEPGSGTDAAAGDFGGDGAAADELAAEYGAEIGVPWDRLRGGAAQDVGLPEARKALELQVRRTAVTWWAPECKTFSRARGRPVAGASSWPKALRSPRYPEGLPGIAEPGRERDKERVEAGNLVAEVTLTNCLQAHRDGRSFAIENPAGSFFWSLVAARCLAAGCGVQWVECNMCMFEGGRRSKRTGVLTNIEEIVKVLGGRVCTGGSICDRTGLAHDSWDPKVVDGAIVNYPTAAEAEYSAGFCEVIAGAVIEHLRARRRRGDTTYELIFTEVFSGPRAPLTAAVAARCGGWDASTC